MKAVILAAGEGKRLRPFTETMSKVMIPVANKPMLAYVIDAVKQTGIDEIIVIVGYKKEGIQQYFKDRTDITITYVPQEKQLGTAHALLQAKKQIKDDFLVVSGDNIIDAASLQNLIQDPAEHSMVIKQHEHSSKFGVVTHQDHILKEFVEKPAEDTMGYIATGAYKFTSAVFPRIQSMVDDGEFGIPSLVKLLLEDQVKINTITTDFWMDIVYPWDILTVNEVLMNHLSSSKSGEVEKGVITKGPVVIGEGSKIYSGSYLVGPVIIGENCEIGPNAVVFPSTTIGNNSVVHPFCELRNCVLMDDVTVGSHSRVSNSIVGRGSSMESTFSTLLGPAKMEVEDELIKMDGIGTILGEYTSVGSNVVVDPGIIIGRNCTIGSLKEISKNIPSKSVVM
jgi:glucose-1-phosphate thymidylyltransferase